jgi:hypothetical protein
MKHVAFGLMTLSDRNLEMAFITRPEYIIARMGPLEIEKITITLPVMAVRLSVSFQGCSKV